MVRTVRVVVSESDVEWVSDALWGLGVVAIEEIATTDSRVILRTSLGEDVAAVRAAMASLPMNLDWTFEEVDDRSVEAWRDHVRPFEVGSSTLVVPAWRTEPVDAAGRLVVRIEPGSTFGLGDHPTTRGCLTLIESLDLVERSVLDVGCGSGILGIVALMRGARVAHGVDINPASVEVSRNNAVLNSVSRCWSVSGDLDDERRDIVFANILAPVLIEMSQAISDRVAPSGRLILSGMLQDRHEHVLRAYPDFVVTEHVVVDGWVTLMLGRG
jgi:ribosomal protein L11 methyltransferase